MNNPRMARINANRTSLAFAGNFFPRVFSGQFLAQSGFFWLQVFPSPLAPTEVGSALIVWTAKDLPIIGVVGVNIELLADLINAVRKCRAMFPFAAVLEYLS